MLRECAKHDFGISKCLFLTFESSKLELLTPYSQKIITYFLGNKNQNFFLGCNIPLAFFMVRTICSSIYCKYGTILSQSIAFVSYAMVITCML